jgi:hypothetical protein
MANTAFRIISGHGDVAVACRYSDCGLFGQRVSAADPCASLCGIRHIQPRHLIRSGLGDIDDCLVRQADFGEIWEDALSLTKQHENPFRHPSPESALCHQAT